MRNPFSRAATVDFWFEISATLGLLGVVTELVSLALDVRWLMVVGMYCVLPLLFCVAVLVFVLIPIVLVSNWRVRRK
jgi:hypothetical protein